MPFPHGKSGADSSPKTLEDFTGSAAGQWVRLVNQTGGATFFFTLPSAQSGAQPKLTSAHER
jgi:hypothetical protein